METMQMRRKQLE